MDTLSIIFLSSLLSFKSDFKGKITPDSVVVAFGTAVILGDTAIGSIRFNRDHWVLSIHKDFYNYCVVKYPGRIKGLIYHELGHVLLGLPHRKGRHIMNPDYADLDLNKKRNKRKIKQML